MPKKTPPKGRTKKPTANVANEATVPANVPSSGKNSGPKISAEAIPYR
jgi:hypothetical protein